MFWNRKKKTATAAAPEPADQDQSPRIPLKHIYTDKFGNKWFEYEEPLLMPGRRVISAEVATRFSEMNMTADVLMNFIKLMKKHANSGDIVELFSLISEIEYRLQYVGEEQTMRDLACCYFLIEGEDERTMLEAYRKRKIKIFEEDEACKGFFLQRAYEHTEAFSNTSVHDINEYLKMIQLKIQSGNSKLHQAT